MDNNKIEQDSLKRISLSEYFRDEPFDERKEKLINELEN